MNNENTKEFRVSDYVCIFEKSLNYMAGAILSMLAAGIIYISSNLDLNLSIKEIFQIIDNDPKDFFCILVAVLSTLPYYFYYSLKDDGDWNACNGSKDNWGLLKIYILYEIGIFCFFYLILQGDVHFSLAKLIISIINIVLTFTYLILLFIGNKSRNRIGYFIAVIFLTIIFFFALSINSYYKLLENNGSQNYTTLLLVVLFSCNAGINIFFLTRWDSSEEVGIISNRIKIMIPVISIVIFTVSIIYCYLAFADDWLAMVMMAIWISLYEIAISFIKVRDSKPKVIRCIIWFLIFVFGIPIILKITAKDTILLEDLNLKWLILVGISIYIAAIKYWGYILKFLFIDKEQAKLKPKIMSVMVWFRNSILGSMLFSSIILISSEHYYLSLIIIIICSLITEYFVSKYAFRDHIENNNKIYILGKVIEFFAIIMPIFIFVLENYLNFEVASYLKFDMDLPKNTEIIIAILGVLAMFVYIEMKWNQDADSKEKQSLSFDWNVISLLKKIYESTKKIEFIKKQVLPDKNRRSFITILIAWDIYIAMAAIVLDFISLVPKYRILGLFTIMIIAGFDWHFLSKHLLGYYIDKMKEGKNMVIFEGFFQREWNECLKTLSEFKGIDAEQFKVGDRLRPIMFYFGSCYKRYGNLNEKDYVDIAKAACSLELIHKASVIFDDYIDKDSLRKGAVTFHEQYPDINIMILLGNAMLAKAQTNFIECRDNFKCSDSVVIDGVKELSQTIINLSTGCCKELSRANYDKQDVNEIKEIIYLETVSLIEKSISLGYRCFHEDQGHENLGKIEQLGKAFGYVFQYLNDLEPFSQRELYEGHKGKKSHFDYGKKNIALITLYKELQTEEKAIFDNPDYDKIMKLYQKYEIEHKVLEMVKEEISKINDLLMELDNGDKEWVKAFKSLFNLALERKMWKEKIASL